MKLSTCCNVDMIYLGKSNREIIDGLYNYCCSKCGKCEWSSEKERCKLKWYKFDKDKLEELLRRNYQEKVQTKT